MIIIFLSFQVCSLIYLVYEHAAVHAGDLATSHVRNLEVGMQQQLATEGELLARVVHSDVEVKLLFAQDQSVRKSEPVETLHHINRKSSDAGHRPPSRLARRTDPTPSVSF